MIEGDSFACSAQLWADVSWVASHRTVKECSTSAGSSSWDLLALSYSLQTLRSRAATLGPRHHKRPGTPSKDRAPTC